MASTWSKATLLRRMEQAYEEQHDRPLFDADGDVTDATTTVAEMVTYLSRQIVVEAMTGRRTSDTPVSPATAKGRSPKNSSSSGDGE